MAVLSKAAYDAEVARKKSLGIPLNNGVPTPPMRKNNTTGGNMTNSKGLPPGAKNLTGPKPTTGIPKSNPVPTPPSNDAYFNKNYGGKDKYATDQGKRYEQAVLSGDTAMQDKLKADSARVGYSLPNVPVPPQVSNTTMVSGVQSDVHPGAKTFTDISGATADRIHIPKQPTIPVMDMNKIGAYVDGQLQAELTRQRSAADQAINAGKLTSQQQIAAIRAAADKLRATTQENRALENTQFDRTNDPSNGMTSYRGAMMDMQRERSDREFNQDILSQEGNVNANLAQLENQINAQHQALQQTQGAERERMIQQIKNDERMYESMLRGDLRADMLANSDLRNADFNRNLQSWQANRGAFESDRAFDYNKSQDQIRNDAQYGGTYNGQMTVDQAQRDWQNRFDYGSAIGTFGNGQQTMQNRMFQEDTRRNNRDYDYQVGRDGVMDNRYQNEWDYNVGRDKMSDQQWRDEFNYRAGQDRINNSQEWSRINDSRGDSNRAASNAAFDQFNTIWQRTGEAPFDFKLPNGYVVKAGTKYTGQFDGGGSSSGNVNLDTDPDFQDDYSFLLKNPDKARLELSANPQQWIQKYGVNGYNKLLQALPNIEK